jgi:hypothetical protein
MNQYLEKIAKMMDLKQVASPILKNKGPANSKLMQNLRDRMTGKQHDNQVRNMHRKL